ncbi:unnamed protein product [Peronospora belbahrii]|uniref:Uncharacterized protein n=1 Tax=Peronospora belbahrii TaxID=622444 RepID=A0ABN8DC05_9STRA|nr:unnamed protein product [Peronospora belbahrii]
MMEEVLELLASENTSVGLEKNSATCNENYDGQTVDVMQTEIAATCKKVVRESKANEIHGHCNVEIPSSPLHLTGTASQRSSPTPQRLLHGAVPQSLAANPCSMDFACAPESCQSFPLPIQEPIVARKTIASALIPISPPASLLHYGLQDLQLPIENPRTSAALLTSGSSILLTGQRVHVSSSAEFEELRRKEAARHKKMHLQKLQVELSHLQYMEAETKQYQEHSVDSLQQELKMHQDVVADLCSKLQDAAREELDWVTHLPS